MIRIAQHTAHGDLVDLKELLIEVRNVCRVEYWRISVQECLGEGADEIEQLSEYASLLFESERLESLYKGIYQTIDGEFVGFSGNQEICRLSAVDSSFWEISGPPELEFAVQSKYALYR